jgi:hypothetical protein
MKLYLGLAYFLLLLVYLPLALIGLCVMFAKIRRRQTRAWAIPLYLILAYLIPLGDVTWHSWNMAKVCPKAGVRIYRTVKADGFTPSSDWAVLNQGYLFGESRPDPKNGLVTRWEMTDSGIVRVGPVPPKSEWELVTPLAAADYELGVTAYYAAIQNRLTKEVIADKRAFTAWKGWLDAWIGSVITNSAGSCEGGARMLHNYITEILIPPEKQP